jgi:hypothetical protein
MTIAAVWWQRDQLITACRHSTGDGPRSAQA